MILLKAWTTSVVVFLSSCICTVLHLKSPENWPTYNTFVQKAAFKPLPRKTFSCVEQPKTFFDGTKGTLVENGTVGNVLCFAKKELRELPRREKNSTVLLLVEKTSADKFLRGNKNSRCWFRRNKSKANFYVFGQLCSFVHLRVVQLTLFL